MEASEFAEKILFGPNIEDKLFAAIHLTDELPRPRGKLNFQKPGRNRLLEPASESSFRFPKAHEFESEMARSHALHHFANHELLAIEIMAMTLLRFPDAPKAFRRGLLSTIADEQKHLSLYIRRIRDFGFEFGDLPLNDFFWKSFCDIEHPIDFTVRMSLTFEQANLDFSRYYLTLFEKIGDIETARILQTVYDDEVVHVRHGLHWFDQWRPQEQNRWQSFTRLLPFPLTPQRAKGRIFYKEARTDAGLDAHFIECLETFSASKGRVPSLFLFHPDCEEEWISKHYQRPRHTQKLFEDLSYLPAYSAKNDDTILVHERPSTEFLKNLKLAGFEVPELLTIDELPAQRERKFSSFEPWGWTPQIARWIKQRKLNFAQSAREKSSSELFSKAWSARLLKDYLEESSEEFLCPKETCGKICSNEDEALKTIENSLRSFPQVAVKAVFGASGRYFLKTDAFPLAEPQRRLLRSFFKKQPAVIVEPWLDKVFDYSLQITAVRGKPVIHGQARFLTTAAGQYQGALLGGFTLALSEETKRFLNANGRDPKRMQRHFESLAAFVSKRANELGYTGPIGIDALFYRDPQGELRLRPIVETNCRYNMGRIVVDMEKKLSLPGAGLWRIFHCKELQKYGFASLEEFKRRLGKIAKPLVRSEFERTGRYYVETTPSANQEFISLLLWGADYNSLKKILAELSVTA